MNQPMTFMWNNETAEMAKKAGATGGISETGAYEGEIVSAVYTFGKDGSQSQALELSLDSNGLKANFLRINFLGKDGQQTFGMGLVSALMWVAQVKQAQPQQARDLGEKALALAEARAAGSSVLFVSHDLALADHFERTLELGA